MASGISEKVGDMINSFIEALAVLLVTSCVIPILVMLLFVWLVKVTFSVSLPVSYTGRGERRQGRLPPGWQGGQSVLTPPYIFPPPLHMLSPGDCV